MELTMAGALNAALRDAMREDDSVVVYGEDVGLGFGHFDGALEVVASGADGGANAQAALFVFGSARVFALFLYVFYCDESL